MWRGVRALVHAGVRHARDGAERRRIQTVNVVALMAISLNLVFSTTFFLFLEPSGPWPLLGLNLLIVAAYAASLGLNAQAKTDPAMWIVNSAGLANITLSALVLGLGLGSIAFFVVVPLTAVLTSREDDRAFPALFTAGSLIALVVVVAVEPTIPGTVAGTSRQSVILAGNVGAVVVFATVVALYYRRRVDQAEAELAAEHRRSEALLLNILPAETAERLKAGERVIADSADDVVVVFADLVGSTPMTEALDPDELVAVLNAVFSAFDDLTDEHGLEKIKTVGDEYIAVAGLPTARPNHVEAAAELALALRREIRQHSVPGYGRLQMRFGMHIGPVIAGVIGKRKYSYDLWGDTVNVASRMESQGTPGEIQVTQAVRDRLDGVYALEPRGTVEVKGKGRMATYFLRGRVGADGG